MPTVFLEMKRTSSCLFAWLLHGLATAVLVAMLPLLAASSAWSAEKPAATEAATDQRPNVLFAFADDWSWPHAGAYGDPAVKTPTFDRVAREGVLFNQAFVSSPSCTPSRGAVLSGQHFWRLGRGANLWSTLDAAIPVYPDLLADAGYFVGYSRKGWGPGRIEPGGRTQNPAGPHFQSFEEFLKARPRGKPFCFWFGGLDPHRPYRAALRKELGVDPAKVRVPPIFPDTPAVREDIADYYAEVQRFDGDVGQMLAKLGELGELDRTVVVVSGDNGWPFPRCKANIYDSGTRVPLAIRWPQKVAGGRKRTDPVSLCDLAPTFLDAAGVAVPAQMTGRSLMGMLTSDRDGTADAERTAVFFGRERHAPCQEAPISGGFPARAIRTSDYLYIWNVIPDRWPAGTPHYQQAYMDKAWLGDTDNGPTKFSLWAHRDDPAVKRLYDLAFAKRPAEELYDLRKDPDQLHNVAADAGYTDVKRELKSRLMEELRKTDDPRVVGGGEKFDEYPYYGGVPDWPGEKVIEQYQ